MSKQTNTVKAKAGIELLREAFPEHQISKLPKPTKRQTEEVRSDFKVAVRCEICGGWHHPKVIHLDYVGHAALTDRLLDCDTKWNWEPVSTTEDGTPKFDSVGGMWIRLTVCDVTRLGYGHAEGKSGGDAIKEVIGDALRNAAMRFGAALDLWHKGDLHIVEDDDGNNATAHPPKRGSAGHDVDNAKPAAATNQATLNEIAIENMEACETLDALGHYWKGLHDATRADSDVLAAKDRMKAKLQGSEAA